MSFLGEKPSQAIRISDTVNTVVALAAVSMAVFSCSSDTSASADSALRQGVVEGESYVKRVYCNNPPRGVLQASTATSLKHTTKQK